MSGDATPGHTEVIFFENLKRGAVAIVGGKNSSLGEMVQSLGAVGIRVPPGFATTANAFRRYLTANGLDDVIHARLAALAEGRASLHQTGSAFRAAIAAGVWPGDTAAAIRAAYCAATKHP